MTPERVILGLCLFFATCATAPASDVCLEVTPASAARLVHYVAGKYRVSAQASLGLEGKEQVTGTCYWKLVFKGNGALGPYRLTLYASPDLRFLSSEILDSSVDPEREERAQAEKRMGQLLEGESAAIGPDDAPVTVVVFSDFQCPYCKKLQALLAAEPLIGPGGGIRLIFRHMPGTRHEWAQKASEAAACAQLQNSDAFWRLHDALFESQEVITAHNVAAKVEELASRIETLNARDFKDCLTRQMSLGIVLRDRQLGVTLGVEGTPTIFINGELQAGLPDAGELHRRLKGAVGEASARLQPPR